MATRWGICSAGKISHDFLVALRTLSPEDHEVVAVAARELQRAEEFARKHKIPVAYGSYEELAKDPNVDVVYVGTVHPHHLTSGKLFMKAKKSVLIEKPLAMNLREVQELLSAARDNHVFLMEAVWTRFFPVSLEVKRRLSQGEVGEVQMVRADLGAPLTHIPRMAEKELGGGALLDLGVYSLQFVLMVFNGERPESIQATGHCIDTGVDGTVVLVLRFSGNRLAVCTCSITMVMACDAVINGTKGSMMVPDHMWCPTTLKVKEREMQFPLPEASMPLNFINSTGLRYEAEEVRRCLQEGLKESPGMPWSHSSLIAEIIDEARRQLGVAYDQDHIQISQRPQQGSGTNPNMQKDGTMM